MIRKIGFGLLLLLPISGLAVDQFSLNFDSIGDEHWRMQGVEIGFSELNTIPQVLTLKAKKMVLPEPFDAVSWLDLNCSKLQLNDQEIICQHGIAKLKTPWLDATTINFSFHFSKNINRISFSQIRFASGKIEIKASLQQGIWFLNLQGKALKLEKVVKFLPLAGVAINSGQIDLQAKAEFNPDGLQAFTLNTQLSNLGLQSEDDRLASEGLAANLRLQANLEDQQWHYDSTIDLTKGGVYIEPIFLDLAANPIEFNTEGQWAGLGRSLALSNINLKHQNLFELTGNLELNAEEPFVINLAELSFKSQDLQTLSTNYLQPFFEASELQGLSLTGELQARLSIVQQALTKLWLQFSQVDISDDSARITLTKGRGVVNWTNQRSSASQSHVAWDGLQIFAIPIGPSAILLNTDDGYFVLNQRAVLALLDGHINIEHFSVQTRAEQEPDIYFAGSIDAVSLQALTKALAWQPFSGTLTGSIPGIRYGQGRLEIDGELKAQVFDGEVRINKLAWSGMFTDFAQFYSEIEIDNLDLHQLTQTFDFGGISGRLSGYVRDVYLENWQPVTLDAWLGTPEDDNSQHRISQKAVNNIASIGGGGAADVLSRTFLRFFDEFGYDRIGIGCHLQQGVCQLQGVETSEFGYVIVKGGGLPRIDVIGYNSRIDWPVLLQRLKRVIN